MATKVPSFDWPTERPYFATLVRVVDGDTIHASIDLGFKISYNDYPIRLLGCNAAEHNTAAGKAAKANLTKRLPIGTPLILASLKTYKYGGEYVARVFVDGVDLVAELISEQWVAPWNGDGERPLAPWPRTVKK